jgi:hypothetical protein
VNAIPYPKAESKSSRQPAKYLAWSTEHKALSVFSLWFELLLHLG